MLKRWVIDDLASIGEDDNFNRNRTKWFWNWPILPPFYSIGLSCNFSLCIRHWHHRHIRRCTSEHFDIAFCQRERVRTRVTSSCVVSHINSETQLCCVRRRAKRERWAEHATSGQCIDLHNIAVSRITRNFM